MRSSSAGGERPAGLLDLRFLEIHVLPHDGIIFPEAHLLGRVARILLGHVVKAGVSRADELDLDRGRLGHGAIPNLLLERPKPPEKQKAAGAARCRPSGATTEKCQGGAIDPSYSCAKAER